MAKFIIGGKSIEVPPLNLRAMRVAMRQATALAGGEGQDAQLDASLLVLEAALATTSSPLTKDELEDTIRGVGELNGVAASIQLLMKESGFTEGEDAPAGAEPGTLTPTSTASSSLSSEKAPKRGAGTPSKTSGRSRATSRS